MTFLHINTKFWHTGNEERHSYCCCEGGSVMWSLFLSLNNDKTSFFLTNSSGNVNTEGLQLMALQSWTRKANSKSDLLYRPDIRCSS